MEEIKCIYEKQCNDYPGICASCANNKAKRSYYTPLEPYTPYVPYYPYYPTYPYYPVNPWWIIYTTNTSSPNHYFFSDK